MNLALGISTPPQSVCLSAFVLGFVNRFSALLLEKMYMVYSKHGKGLESACVFQKKVEELLGLWNLCEGTEFCGFFLQRKTDMNRSGKKQDYKGGVGKAPQKDWYECSNLYQCSSQVNLHAGILKQASHTTQKYHNVLTLKLSLDVRTDAIEV